MKKILPLLFTALSAVSLQASVIGLSGTASSTATGFAGPGPASSGGFGIGSFNESQTDAAPFSSINQNEAGYASWFVTSPSFVNLRSDSSANQTASVTSTGVALSGSVAASNKMNPGSPIASIGATGATVFDLIFHVDTASTFSLNLTGFRTPGAAPAPTPLSNNLNFSLVSLDNSFSIDLSDFGPIGMGPLTWNGTYNGAFAVGDYRLIHNVQQQVFGDPIGDSRTANFSLNLTVTPSAAPPSVPDAGALHLTLLATLGALAFVRRNLGAMKS